MTTHTPVPVNPRISRQLTCPHGHDISTTDKVYVRADGRRRCRRCAIASAVLTKRAQRALLPPKPARLPKPCAVAGCDLTARVRGWCNPHYRRWVRNGDTGDASVQRRRQR